MKNLKPNVIKLLLIEVVLAIILVNVKLDVFAPFVVLLAFSVNITYSYYLIRHKPTGYLILIFLLLLPIIIPLCVLIAAINTMQC